MTYVHIYLMHTHRYIYIVIIIIGIIIIIIGIIVIIISYYYDSSFSSYCHHYYYYHCILLLLLLSLLELLYDYVLLATQKPVLIRLTNIYMNGFTSDGSSFWEAEVDAHRRGQFSGSGQTAGRPAGTTAMGSLQCFSKC